MSFLIAFDILANNIDPNYLIMRSFLHKDNFVSLVKNKIMKKTALIALLFPLCTAIAQTTDDFVPQEMDWGTYLKGINYGSSGNNRNFVVTNEGGVVLGGFASSEEDSYWSEVITPDTHQNQVNGNRDGVLYGINADGTINFGTFFGGEGQEQTIVFAADAYDNFYVHGSTNSYENISTDETEYSGYIMPPLLFENPVTGEVEEIGGGTTVSDGFLAKFNSEGNLLWATYVGGQRGASVYQAILGQTGIYVFGATLSIDGFTTPSAYQPDWPEDVPQDNAVGEQQGLVSYMAKYNFDGQMIWRTYSHGFDYFRELMALDEQDNIYRVQNNGFKITKFNSDGQFQSQNQLPSNVAHYSKLVIKDGYFYFTGATESSSFGTPDTFRSELPVGEVYSYFLMKCDINMQKIWATYLPRNQNSVELHELHEILIDDEQNVYVGNSTFEADLGTEGVFQEQISGLQSAYAMKLNNGGALQWFTYFGSQTNRSSALQYNMDYGLYCFTASQGTDNIVNENGLFNSPDNINASPFGERPHLMKLVKSKSSSTDDFLKGKINVYPNPAKDILNIDLSDELLSNQLSYALYDLLGKQIANGSIGVSQNHQINVSNLATGVYLLKITDQATQASQQFKIIKE